MALTSLGKGPEAVTSRDLSKVIYSLEKESAITWPTVLLRCCFPRVWGRGGSISGHCFRTLPDAQSRVLPAHLSWGPIFLRHLVTVNWAGWVGSSQGDKGLRFSDLANIWRQYCLPAEGVAPCSAKEVYNWFHSSKHSLRVQWESDIILEAAEGTHMIELGGRGHTYESSARLFYGSNSIALANADGNVYTDLNKMNVWNLRNQLPDITE